MIELFIDPGSKVTGLALGAGISTPACAKLKNPTTEDTYRVLAWALRLGVERLVIEGQHVRQHGPKQKINWPSVTTLMLSAHRWIVLSEFLSIPVDVVQPGEWQGPMLADIPTKRDGKSLTVKQRSQMKVRQVWASVTRLDLDRCGNADVRAPIGDFVLTDQISQDECDAACIFRWWTLTGRRQRSAR